MQAAFIIGSPRSGTTILENILHCHPEIAEWYEPYYLWGQYFSNVENDIWNPADLTSEVKKRIRREFKTFSRRTKKEIVLDKSPSHVFNINIIQAVFPDAKWIHIIRDGRDVTLSIRKEWHRRKEMVLKKDFRKLFQVAKKMLERQPFWKYKLMAIHYEIKSNLTVRPTKYLNKSKWNGKVGWGPRFDKWQQFLQTHSELEFNAMQWVKSVEAAHRIWSILPEKNKIEIRYEDLLNNTHSTLSDIFAILNIKPDHNFFAKIPQLNRKNFNKWESGFSDGELKKIKPILGPLIEKLSYAASRDW
jgi:hypothetical protein